MSNTLFLINIKMWMSEVAAPSNEISNLLKELEQFKKLIDCNRES
jgi:hypothetical protein